MLCVVYDAKNPQHSHAYGYMYCGQQELTYHMQWNITIKSAVQSDLWYKTTLI